MEETLYQPLILTPALNPTLVTDGEGIDKMLVYFENLPNKIIGWDKETNIHQTFFWRRDRTWQFGTTDRQFVIDLLAFVDGDSTALSETQGHYGIKLDPRLKYVTDKCAKLVCSDEYLKCGVNLGFEYEQSYWNFGQRTWHLWSCDMVERVIWAGAHSLKDYDFYSMEEMVKRYFNRQIDKSLQQSFNLTDPLTQAQVHYAALDTRVPLALRNIQLRKKYIKGSNQVGGGLIEDRLLEVATIENNAIGAFIDMHVHGQRINRKKWGERDAKKREALAAAIAELDTITIPIVGTKTDITSEEDIEKLQAAWKSKTVASDEEIKLLGEAKRCKDPVVKAELMAQVNALAFKRVEEKEKLKAIKSVASKRRTKIKNLAEKCEGQALVNYASGAQMLELFKNFKELKDIEDCDDSTLEKYDKHPLIKAYRKYSELSKQVSTYGVQFITEWTKNPGSDVEAGEGWLHPGDGRIHPKFNQLEAETGRSSSSQPNGQNLPQDPELRSCFECDPPNEDIRISVCCDDETIYTRTPAEIEGRYVCKKCGHVCDTKPEEYCIVTADMSGAELRIIAELANAPSWINAFARDEDVHSVGTELMYPEKWPSLTVASLLHPDKWTLEDVKTELIPLFNPDGTPMLDKKGKPKMVPPCAYFACKDNGDHAREKCECPEHKKLRDGNKSTNFLLAYGGVAATLAARIGVTIKVAEEIMRLHEKANPEVWDYLEKSGKLAVQEMESRSMFDRRRRFPEMSLDEAREKVIEEAKSNANGRWEKAMRKEFVDIYKGIGVAYDGSTRKTFKDVLKDVTEAFEKKNGHKPKKEELFEIVHMEKPLGRTVTDYRASYSQRVERQGKNHRIQATNADIIKLAMGCGFDKDGKPYLWHILPTLKAKLLAMVHDELIVQCPKRLAKQVAFEIGDAFRRAAATKMTKVIMKFDFHIAPHWQK